MYRATTTYYGGTGHGNEQGSCGGCNVAMFTRLENWVAVATSVSMQKPYACHSTLTLELILQGFLSVVLVAFELQENTNMTSLISGFSFTF